jgi:hypothetical protein
MPGDTDRSPELRAALSGAGTLWAAACALLRCWRSDPSGTPARLSTGQAYDEWAERVDVTQRHFLGPRAAEDFHDGDREFLWSVTDKGRSPDAVHAAAWGLSNAASVSFAPAWRDQLGGGRHTLADGELYPVADAPWTFPDERLSPRPASLTSPAIGELPYIRAHDASRFDATVHFTLARTLEAVAASLDQADRFRVALAVCKELLDGRVTSALDRMAVNLLLVPALSARTAPFLPAVDARVAAAQALTVVVNGPLRGADGALIEPAIVIGQPVDGRSAVGCEVSDAAPVLTVIPLPAQTP